MHDSIAASSERNNIVSCETHTDPRPQMRRHPSQQLSTFPCTVAPRAFRSRRGPRFVKGVSGTALGPWGSVPSEVTPMSNAWTNAVVVDPETLRALSDE